MGLNWLDDAPKTVTRIKSITKADSHLLDTKKDIIKRRRTKIGIKSVDTSLRNCHRLHRYRDENSKHSDGLHPEHTCHVQPKYVTS